MSDADRSVPALPSRGVLGMLLGAFFVLTLSVYGASLSNDFVRWDDGLLIYQNPAISDPWPSALVRMFTTYDPELYIPLTLISYKIDYSLAGVSPGLYHFHNLVLHTLNAFLVMCLAYLLSRRKWVGIACGVLFAVHPLHTEAVAWASARKDLLSTLFFLLTFITYLLHRGSGERRLWYVSLACFTLGLLAKVSIVTLPILLLLNDARERRTLSVSLVIEKIPYFVLSVIFGVVALLGKQAIVKSTTMLETFLMACKSAVFYLQKLFLPTHLSVLYPYVGDIRISSFDFLIPLLILLVLCIGSILLYRKAREVVFGFWFYLIVLIPSFVNFAKDGDFYFASDRYAYIPSIGILYLFCWLVYRWVVSEEHVARQAAKYKAVTVGIAVLVTVFSVGAFRQSRVWASTDMLFENVVELYPESHRAQNNLGNVYRRKNMLPEAIEHLEAALAIRSHPLTRSNLGAAYRKMGQTGKAVAQYQKAIEEHPDAPEPYFGWGIVSAEQGDTEAAFSMYAKALAIDPNYPEVYVNRGALHLSQGDPQRAIEDYEHALELQPTFVQAHYNLGVAYGRIGDIENAVGAYERALDFEPEFLSARTNLGLAYAQLGDVKNARKQFEEILHIDPQNRGARNALEQLKRR